MRRRSFVRKTLSVMAVGALPATVWSACSDDPDEGGTTGPDGNDDVVEVRLRSDPFVFDPASVTVAVGTTIRWVNDSDDFHTVTPEGHDEFQRWATDGRGQTFEHTFESAGTYPYFCEPHRSLGMEGRIVVE